MSEINGDAGNRICVFNMKAQALMRWWRLMPGPAGELVFETMNADPDQDLVITVSSSFFSAEPLDAPPVLGPDGEPEPRNLSLVMRVHPWHLDAPPGEVTGAQGIWKPHPEAASHTDETGATDIIRRVSGQLPFHADLQQFRDLYKTSTYIGPDGTLLLYDQQGMYEVWDWRTADILLVSRRGRRVSARTRYALYPAWTLPLSLLWRGRLGRF